MAVSTQRLNEAFAEGFFKAAMDANVPAATVAQLMAHYEFQKAAQGAALMKYVAKPLARSIGAAGGAARSIGAAGGTARSIGQAARAVRPPPPIIDVAGKSWSEPTSLVRKIKPKVPGSVPPSVKYPSVPNPKLDAMRQQINPPTPISAAPKAPAAGTHTPSSSPTPPAATTPAEAPAPWYKHPMFTHGAAAFGGGMLANTLGGSGGSSRISPEDQAYADLGRLYNFNQQYGQRYYR